MTKTKADNRGLEVRLCQALAETCPNPIERDSYIAYVLRGPSNVVIAAPAGAIVLGGAKYEVPPQ